ncbi:FAD synthetase [Rhodotorula toruloides]|uniref:FAD synthase n=1 Tax=Rhodotorula toruloides TaxID=5286 RepID=A0A511KQH6_RHOTO|nr:FAD synthetase [Rhodotorula toruloides]
MAHSLRPVAASADADDDRQFTVADAQRVYTLATKDTRLGGKVREALDVVERALDEYGLERIALSFNGGKDCTVLVHLLAAAILRRQDPSLSDSPSPSSASTSSRSLPPIPTIYVRCPSPFPQVEAFVALCARWYALELETVEGGMREALQVYVDRRKTSLTDGASAQRGAIKAVLVGTRRNDPHGQHLQPFSPTDAGWPDFMRVHPILNWSYGDVWAFLRAGELTLGAGAGDAEEEWKRNRLECYTSLGSTHNTFPNPLLRATTSGPISRPSSPTSAAREKVGQPLGGWRPAWELEDESAERAGRETSLSKVLEQTRLSPPTTITTGMNGAERG